MSAAELITLMLPYSATALILLLIWIQVAAAKAPHVCGSEKDKTLLGFSDRKELNMEYLAAYLILFTICLLTVHISFPIPDSSCIGSYIYAAKKQGKYKQGGLLLATFIALFIFIGNLEGFRNSAVFWKESWQEGKHLLLFLPVRLCKMFPLLLLSGFTDNYRGFNCRNQYWRSWHSDCIHGKPYKFSKYIARKQESERKYLGIFTVSNIIFMIFMLILYFLR